MNPPQVKPLDQIIGDLNPAYAQSEGLIGQQRGGLGIKYDSQRSALTAEKGQGFNAINEGANAKGLAFGGIPAHEQAGYLSTKFLPGMQKLGEQQNQEDMQLQMALAEIGKEKRLKATDIRGQQESAYNQYMEAERDRAYRAEQARVQREFDAQQAAASRAASASQSAASGTSAYDAIYSMLQASAGGDGKVSPNVWRNAAAYAKQQGLGFGGKDGFANKFWNFANSKHGNDYTKGYEAYM